MRIVGEVNQKCETMFEEMCWASKPHLQKKLCKVTVEIEALINTRPITDDPDICNDPSAVTQSSIL